MAAQIHDMGLPDSADARFRLLAGALPSIVWVAAPDGMGGELRARSWNGEGSSFTLSLRSGASRP